MSSSTIISTPKRSALDYDLAPPKRLQTADGFSNEKQAEKLPVNDIIPVNARPPIHDGLSRIGASNSDLPHHKPVQYPKIVSKSISDSAVTKEQPSTKPPKLTLFNKEYTASVAPHERNQKDDDEDDDENSISFVKPKSSTSTLFSNKNKDSSKSKLAMMLSFLRGDESRDEVDKPLNKIEKSEEKTEITTGANLSTNTVVTFSTATTTSVLNSTSIPASTITSSSIVEPKSQEAEKDISKIETKPLISFSPMPKSTVSSSESAKTTTAASTSTMPTTLNNTIASTSANESVPRLGGFAFSATSPTQTQSNESKTLLNSTTTSGPAVTTAAPAFSFGLAKPAASTTAPALTFGSPKGVDAVSTASSSAAPPMFSFGSPNAKPTEPQTTKISFSLPTTNAVSTVQSAPVSNTATPTFAFGSPSATTTASSSANTSSLSISFGNNAANPAAPMFGAAKENPAITAALQKPSQPAAAGDLGLKAPPAYGSVKPTFGAATTTSSSALNPSAPSFSFGNSNTGAPSNTGN